MEFVRRRTSKGKGGRVCVVNVTHCLQVGWICSFNEILGLTFLQGNLKDPLTYRGETTQLEKEDLIEFTKILANLAKSKQEVGESACPELNAED